MPLTVSLQHQRVAITGSTSGIGLAMARRFAEADATVILHGGHSADRLQRAEQEIAGSESVGIVDIGTPEGCDLFVDQLKSLGPVDVLINNAGADVLTGNAADSSFARKSARVWEVDVRGTMLLSRSIGNEMVKRQTGCIINIGWDQAAWGMAGDSGEMFAASKGAVMGFSRSLAQSLAPHVRVNAIAPGWIKTAWGENTSDYWVRRAQNESLLDRWGEADDVANAALWLASPMASFINGQVIAVNGGFRYSWFAEDNSLT